MQKQFISAGSMLIMALFSLGGCEKECGCNSTNQIKFEEVTLSLNKAILENWGEHVQDETYDGYRLIVGAFSPGVTIHYSNADVDSLSGTGHGILFEIFSESPNAFDKRDFSYSTDHTIGSFSFGLVYHNFNFANDNWLEEEFINSGTLSLSAIDGTLRFEFTGYFESGKSVSADYSGDFIFLEITE